MDIDLTASPELFWGSVSVDNENSIYPRFGIVIDFAN